MTENRRQILDMLSQGKITVDEAERLMEVFPAVGRIPVTEGDGLGLETECATRHMGNTSFRGHGWAGSRDRAKMCPV